MAHWKIGHDFAIRYGGYADIQWFKGSDFEEVRNSIGGGTYSGDQGLSAVPVIEVLKVAALFLQWWELRRQNNLQSASFEERRHQWIADLLAQLSAEINEGFLRGDTIRYLDLECGKMLVAVAENSKVDIPSSLLLMLERLTNSLVGLNHFLEAARHLDKSGTKTSHGIPEYSYVPYFELVDESVPTQGLEKQMAAGLEVMKHGPKAIGFAAGIAASFFTAPAALTLMGASALLGGLWSAISNKRDAAPRRQEFQVLANLQCELRSCGALTHILATKEQRFLEFQAVQSGATSDLVATSEPQARISQRGLPSDA